MVRWVVGSILHGGPTAVYRSSQCTTTGVTKVVLCVILSGMMHIRVAYLAAAGFLSRYLSGPLPYV